MQYLRATILSCLALGVCACGGSSNSSSDRVTCGKGVTFDAGGTNGYGYELAVNPDSVSLPIDIAFLPGSSSAFLLISQTGRIYYFNGSCEPVNSLMLDDIGITVIAPGNEEGLLNLELHPDFARNGYVFFYHTSAASETNTITRATLSFRDSGYMALSDAVKIIDFQKNTSASNHNGGGMVFAPDRSLLASVGDGGRGGGGNGQLEDNLLGTVVRINPSLTRSLGGYSIPSAGNMFDSNNAKCSGVTSSATPCPEILAIGLRNPFRMSMAGNIVFLGEVGSGFEEINSFDYSTVDPANPVNFGWDSHDGFTNSSSIAGYLNPIIFYNRDDNLADAFRAEDPEGIATGRASVIIGDVYSGSRYDGELYSKLFFAEFYDGYMRAVGVDRNGAITDTDAVPGAHIVHHGQISSLVEGTDGYMYFTTLYDPAMVYRLVKP